MLTRRGKQVGCTVNVKGMQICPYFLKEIPSQMSTRGGQVVNDGQNLVNVVYERPLIASRVNLVTNGAKTTCLRSQAKHILSTNVEIYFSIKPCLQYEILTSVFNEKYNFCYRPYIIHEKVLYHSWKSLILLTFFMKTVLDAIVN